MLPTSPELPHMQLCLRHAQILSFLECMVHFLLLHFPHADSSACKSSSCQDFTSRSFLYCKKYLSKLPFLSDPLSILLSLPLSHCIFSLSVLISFTHRALH